MGVMARGMVPGAIPGFASESQVGGVSDSSSLPSRAFLQAQGSVLGARARPEALPGRSRGAAALHPGLRRMS